MTSHRSPRPEALPLRLAMIGTGAIAKLHLPAFLTRPDVVRLSRICELNSEAAANLARQLPYPVPVEPDYRRLIDAEDVDAALVALPHHLHYPVAAELVQAGIPVLVEKPLTCTLQEARQLHAISQKNQTPVVSGQMLRFSREANSLKDWIIADPQNFGALRTFDLQSWQNILAYTHSASGPGHWLRDGEKAGGGVVISLAIHQLDLIRFLSGQDFVETTALGRFDEPFQRGAESCAVVLLKMSAERADLARKLHSAARALLRGPYLVRGTRNDHPASHIDRSVSGKFPFCQYGQQANREMDRSI